MLNICLYYIFIGNIGFKLITVNYQTAIYNWYTCTLKVLNSFKSQLVYQKTNLLFLDINNIFIIDYYFGINSYINGVIFNIKHPYHGV